jgi:hypothetical protein
VLAYAVLAPLSVLVVLGPPMLVARGLVRLTTRTPGAIGRWVRAWEKTDPGTPAGLLTVVQVLGFLVLLWTGLLGRLILLISGTNR